MEFLLLVLVLFGLLGWEPATALRRAMILREFLIAATEKKAKILQDAEAARMAVEKQRNAATPSVADDLSTADMERMRAELLNLRDTSTQYDMSLQHALERIERRLDHVEGKIVTVAEPEAKAEPVVTQVIRG
jgi:hypothetical protein